ncbi:MAG TPA: response regulator [Thermoanaerobaculia bacterium]|jgi:CheY-like chemotaxis protein
MKRAARILVIEDLPSWQEALAEILRDGGFAVEIAASKAEASKKLAEGLYHLLVVDLRLEEGDPSNVEGMDLLQELTRYGLAESFKVIVLTAYGTRDLMREAFKRHGVDDFWSKQDFDEDDGAFLADVERLLGEEAELNLDLSVIWQGGLDPRQAVLNLLVDGQRIKKSTPEQELLAVEVDDLLCRLFHDAETVLVDPLSTGRSGAGVLLIHPFYSHGSGRPAVVKFGDVRSISDERAKYNEFVRPFVGGGRSTTVVASRRTPRLGGVVYSLVSDRGKRLENFASFYRNASIPQIREVLDGLFLDTCGAWYDNQGKLEPLDLTEYYSQWLGLTTESLTKAREGLKSVQGKDEKLHFQTLTNRRPMPNALRHFPGTPLVVPTYETITHGDLNPQNILVDDTGQSWLIDFQATGPGHVLRDVAELDVSIRIHLLGPGDATLDERLALEETLCKPDSYAQLEELAWEREGSNPAVDKVFATCVHLRTLARRLLARQTGSDLKEYYAATLFCALPQIRFSFLSKVQREHALLSACLLTERHGL